MRPGRYRRAKDVFLAACDVAPEHRARLLDEACGDDDDLRAEVAALLAHDAAPDDPNVGRAIGRYRLVRRLGAGGMGVVYLAERADEAFEQLVAIKLIRRGMDTEEILRRFRHERQVLARLEHPNIARLIDGGSTEDGAPYLVMEHVPGVRLDRFCDERRLTIDERIELFLSVCGAVQYAHQALVVHRDLKGGNILVTDEGTPKLLDFGIARVLEADGAGRTVTATGQRCLTPAYASPEQIRGGPITTASDLYSLGVILYELLTGHRPHRVASTSPGDLERVVCEDPPSRPTAVVRRALDVAGVAERAAGAVSAETLCARRRTSPAKLRRRLAGDLETIILYTLRKEPSRRYASVEQLAEDLRRHRAGLPVRARPDTLGYRTTKFVRRHAVAVAAAAVVVVALVAASVVSTTLLVRTRAAQRETVAQRETAEQISRFLHDMLGSVEPQIAGTRDIALLRGLLDDAAERVTTELGDEPDAAAALHRTIGSTYKGLGLLEEAEDHLRRAVALRRERPGAGGLDLGEALHELGVVLRLRARYVDADSALREALAIRRGALGETHRATGTTLNQLAIVLQAAGVYAEAERTYRAAEAAHRVDPGPGSAELAVTLSTLGAFLKNQQRPDQAEPYLLESVEIARSVYGDRHLGLAGSLHNLASLRRATGRHDEAERDFRAALGIMDEVLEPDHPRRAVTLNNLAGVLESKGDYEAAEPIYREVLRIQRANLGGAHRDVGTTANNLAGLLRKTGRYDEAGSLYCEAIEIYAAALNPDHAWVAIVRASYAQLLESAGDYPAAAEAAAEALRVARQHWADDHWRVAMIESVRGACLAQRGRFAESEPILLGAHAVLAGHLGADHPATRDAARRLARLYEAWGRPEQAAAWRLTPAGFGSGP